MKIGMILDHEFPVDERVEKEALTLIEAGHKVHLLCFTFGRLTSNEKYKGINIHRVYLSKSIAKKISALILTIPLYKWFWKKHIQKFLLREKIDVLHIHDLPLCGIGLDMKFTYKIPIIADMHENYPDLMLESKHTNTILGKLLINKNKWFEKEREWLSKVDNIIVVAEEMKKRLQNILLLPKSYTIIPNTISIEDYLKNQVPNLEIIQKYKNKFVILYFGGINQIRGIDTLINAGKIIQNYINELKIVIVGRGSSMNELMMLTSRLGLEKIIDFVGWQDPNFLNAYMANTQICVIPHIKSPQTDNSSPNKLFIYMLYKKPIITSNCNSIQKIVEKENCGLIFKSKDSNDLADKILKLAKNRRFRSELAQNGYNAVRKVYNWKSTSAPLVELYKGISLKKSI
jgi:glycosyltransferase involved in cell wall biosynthesis